MSRPVVPIHEICMNIDYFYVVWLVYEEVARDVSLLVEESEDHSIMIKFENTSVRGRGLIDHE